MTNITNPAKAVSDEDGRQSLQIAETDAWDEVGSPALMKEG
jgi:hypothetical protein